MQFYDDCFAIELEASFVLDLLITQVGPILEHIIPHWPIISVQLRRIDLTQVPAFVYMGLNGVGDWNQFSLTSSFGPIA